MKKTLSVIAVLLAILMIALCCAACGDENNDGQTDPSVNQNGSSDTSGAAPPANTNDPNNNSGGEPDQNPTNVTPSGSIVGRWSYVMELSKALDSEMDSILVQVSADQQDFYRELFKAFDGVSYKMIMEFSEDGEYYIGTDESSAGAAIEQVKANFKDHLPAMLASVGASMEDFETSLESQNLTIDDYVDMLFSFQMDLENSINATEARGTYRYENGRLYISDTDGNINENDYVVAVFRGNKLTVTSVSGASSAFSEAMLPMEFNRL